MDRPEDGKNEPYDRKWLQLGIGLSILSYAFLLGVLLLLRIDVTLALVVAVGVSVIGGIALTLFALYIY